MHFLLVNDDGFRAEGIRTLARVAMEAGHRVTICAPDRERSGESHAFTAMNVLRAKRFQEDGFEGWSVNGTPADCARLGLYLLRDDVPDMTLSGINHGANLGGACVYSGTVGAAMEASMAGCPSIATSLHMGVWDKTNGFGATARLTLKLVKWAREKPLPRGAFYNLNVPDIPEDEIKGVKFASLAPLFLGEAKYVEGVSPIGMPHFWLSDGVNVPMTDPNSDFLLVEAGYASVTPLTWNMAMQPGSVGQAVDL